MILFIDEICPKPYSLTTNEGNGGTERCVIKIAEGLKAMGLPVTVEQHNRTEAEDIYVPFGTTPRARFVVTLRSVESSKKARERFPDAKVYMWTHDLATAYMAQGVDTMAKNKIDVLCVSQFHKNQTVEVMKSAGYCGQYRTHVVYNPIDDALLPDNTTVDMNKLVFTASPHKGLKNALEIFGNLLSFAPEMRLYVTNPGYMPTGESLHPSIISLGTLPHKESIAHVRSALCLFYPNRVFPETFGLVMAEANAVGTPYLAHNFGAAAEVSDHPAQIVDARDPKKVIDRVLAWRNGERPIVRGRDEFRLSNVLKTWYKLLKD